jgi:hypothetical protein
MVEREAGGGMGNPMPRSRGIEETTMVKSDTELKSAIEGLYRTFSRYPLPPHVDGCPHCVSDADHALLYSKDLRDLGPKELERYV